jgi:hypothetical protein
MTRKDYVALAEALAGEFPVDSGSQLLVRIADWRGIVAAVANVLGKDNPRFDRARFLRACEGK